MKNLILMFVMAGLSGCTVAELSKYVGKTGTLANKQTVVAVGVEQCEAMRVQCVSGQFNEWRTKKQEVRCSCNQ